MIPEQPPFLVQKGTKPKDLPDYFRPCFQSFPGSQPEMVYENGCFYNVSYKEWDIAKKEKLPYPFYICATPTWGCKGVVTFAQEIM